MLVPFIDARKILEPLSPLQDSPLQGLIDQVQHWSLFGKVAVTGVQTWSQVDLEQLARQTGGWVELQVCHEGRSEADLIELLNQGVSAIFAGDETVSVERPHGIPPESWQVLQSEYKVSWQRGQQTWLAQPTAERMAQLDQLGVDLIVDVELLTTQPNLVAAFFQATLVSDRPDGLWPTMIVDELGQALGLAYSNYESLLDAVTHRRGTYWSRSRGGLWVKGLTSGNTQKLTGIRVDCDRDCLRFQVAQTGSGFCHLETYSCFGYERSIATVIDRLRDRCQANDAGSFTKKLIDNPQMLQAKLMEEAGELCEAESAAEVAFEAADVMYFSLVKMLASGVELSEVYQELARRMTRVIRRKNKLE